MNQIQLPNGTVVDTTILIWLIPLALFIMVLIQLLYIAWLRYAPTRGEPRPPEQPIMPAIYASPGRHPSGQPIIQSQPVVLPPAPQPVIQPHVLPPQVQPQPVVQSQRQPPAPAPARGNVA